MLIAKRIEGRLAKTEESSTIFERQGNIVLRVLSRGFKSNRKTTRGLNITKFRSRLQFSGKSSQNLSHINIALGASFGLLSKW